MQTTNVHRNAPTQPIRPPAVDALARPIEPRERDAVLAWLDGALRGGEVGRLEAEYPLSLDRPSTSAHRVVFDRGRPVAHAMLHVVEARIADRRLDVGLIGLVYTDPARRGQGLARACVGACLATLRRQGVPVAALWTDRAELYEGLGFLPAGREDHYQLDADVCRKARAGLAAADGRDRIDVDSARSRDWTALETLYARKASGVTRRRGALKRLARAPRTEVVVARRGGRPIAYAALGRGLDFPGVVHEWAGSESGVLACLEALAGELESVGWRTGPTDEPPGPRLRDAGAIALPRHFAFLNVLDPVAVWERLAAPQLTGAGLALDGCPMRTELHAKAGSLILRPDELVALLFGPHRPPRVLAFLQQPEHEALAQVLPLPLYLWGFDSI